MFIMENMKKSPRIEREGKTLVAMISLYCRDKHRAGSLCPECVALKEYALGRLVKCPFQSAKPTCANCTVHCYAPAMRERVRVFMRYSGPRMIYRHPLMAIAHILDGRRKAPPVAKTNTG